MTALLNYIYTAFNGNQSKNVFISDPPGPAILLWSNSQTHPDLTGVSVVRELHSHNQNRNQQNSQNLIATIVNEIRMKTSIPFLDIEHDFPNDVLVINGTPYNLTDGGNIIANTFNLTISSVPSKRFNNVQSVTDPFHIWSSALFSGATVKKIDTDLVVVDIVNNTLSSFVEVKRSAKANFHTWQPYTSDLANYEMMFSLSDALNLPFYTIHHNDVTNKIISSANLVNVFKYDPTNPLNWNSFRSLQNRQQITAQATIGLL